MKLKFLSVVGVCLVSGCLSVNPVTMARLATLDPLEADPTVMAVELTLPEGVDVADGTAALSLAVENAAGERVDGSYPLVASNGMVWRVAPEAQPQMRADMERARVWERADPDGSNGSFGAVFEPCTTGSDLDPDARFSIRLQLEPGGAFLPLVSNARISAIADAETTAALSPCG